MVLWEAAATAAADPIFTGTHVGMGMGPMVVYALYRDVIPALKELVKRRNGNGNYIPRDNSKVGESRLEILASLASSVARMTVILEGQAETLNRQTKILSDLATDVAIVLDRTPRKE